MVKENTDLVPLCPGRTLEAIKDQRRQADYRRILEELRARQIRPEVQGDLNIPEDRDNEVQVNVRARPIPRRPAVRLEEEDVALEHPIPEIPVQLDLGIPVHHRRPEVRLERLSLIEGPPPVQVELEEVQELDDSREDVIGFYDLRELLVRSGMRCRSPVARGERLPPSPQRPRNRAARKRVEYFKQQKLYSRDKAECLKYVTDKPGYVERTYPPRQIRQEWKRYFEMNPHLQRVNDGEILSVGQNQVLMDSLDGPITLSELEAAIRATKVSTARGLDGMSLRDLQSLNPNQLLIIMNGLMEWVPEELYRGRITLIPKVNNPEAFGDYRPICVMRLAVRILYKILAKRLSVIEHHEF